MDPKQFGIRLIKAAGKGALAGISQAFEEELGNLGDTKSEQLHALADRLGAVDTNKTGIDDLLSVAFRVAAQLFEAGEQRETRP